MLMKNKMNRMKYLLTTLSSPQNHPHTNYTRQRSIAIKPRFKSSIKIKKITSRFNDKKQFVDFRIVKELDEETGLYYYGARYLDPRTSRWLTGDPAIYQGDYIPVAPINDDARKHNQNLPGMGGIFNIVNMHAYHYAGNNPVIYEDTDGRLIRHLSYQRQGFDTMREAAIHVLNFINPISIEFNIEFGGYIYRDSNDGKYYATIPVYGNQNEVTLNRSRVPEDAAIVGDYHTHGDYSLFLTENFSLRTGISFLDSFNSNDFSGTHSEYGDRYFIASRSLYLAYGEDAFNYHGYLGTPSGFFLEYAPWTSYNGNYINVDHIER